MPWISLSNARGILGPHEDQLLASVTAAWRHWEIVREHFPGCSRRGRRNIMHEFIAAEARTRFGGLDGVRLVESRRGPRFLILIGPLVIRPKRVNDRFQTANYPTDTAMKFDAQQPNLPTIPKGIRLTLGYTIDDAEIELTSVRMILLVAKQVIWEYRLGTERGAVEHLQLPFAEPAPAASRIRHKKPVGPKKKGKDE